MKIGIISGASSGIGKCIAKELDRQNLDQLWLIGRNGAKLAELSSSLNSETRLFTLDLTDKSSYEVIAGALQESGAQVEYLVLSAGVGFNGAFETLSIEQISSMTDINCTALVTLTRSALPYVQKGGKIINIASGAGFLPQPYFAVYAATKSFVISFSKGLRYELRKKKIKVCAVCPGPVDTEFFAGLKDVKEYKKKYLISPEKVARGSIKAAAKGKAIFSPTFSMKAVHLMSKLLPSSLLTRIYNE